MTTTANPGAFATDRMAKIASRPKSDVRSSSAVASTSP